MTCFAKQTYFLIRSYTAVDNNEGVRTKPRLSQFFSNKSLGYHRTKETVCHVSTKTYHENNRFWRYKWPFCSRQNQGWVNHVCPMVPQTQITVTRWKNLFSLGFVLTPSIALRNWYNKSILKKHKPFTNCWLNVSPASVTLAQHWLKIS